MLRCEAFPKGLGGCCIHTQETTYGCLDTAQERLRDPLPCLQSCSLKEEGMEDLEAWPSTRSGGPGTHANDCHDAPWTCGQETVGADGLVGTRGQAEDYRSRTS